MGLLCLQALYPVLQLPHANPQYLQFLNVVLIILLVLPEGSEILHLLPIKLDPGQLQLLPDPLQ